jgi:hypothetical protein
MRHAFAIVALVALVALGTIAGADTLAASRAEADARLEQIWPTVQDRVLACVTENPRLCHTAWSASSLCNTLNGDPGLCSMAQDDPGRLDVCGLPSGTGTFAGAGLTLPANDVFAFRVEIHWRGTWGIRVWVRLRHAGTTYERAKGLGLPSAADVAWRVAQ